MLKSKKGKYIAGTVKGVNQHVGSYVNPPFSLEPSLKRIAHFRLMSQESETLFYVIIDRLIEDIQLFQIFTN